ncbi:transcription termination factor 1-like isoform X2 [Lineus longissimus]
MQLENMEAFSFSTGQKQHKKKKRKHRGKEKNIEKEHQKEKLEKGSVVSKHCHKTDTGTGDVHRRKQESEKLAPSEHKTHMKKKHKHKEKENEIEDDKQKRKLVESSVLSRKSHRTDSSSDDEQRKIDSRQLLYASAKHKKKKRRHKEKHFEVDTAFDKMPEEIIEETTGSGSGDEHNRRKESGEELSSSTKHKIKKHKKNRMQFEENFCSESSGAVRSYLGEPEGGKRKSIFRVEDESPRKRHKHKHNHKKDSVVRVEDQSHTSPENSGVDDDLQHKELSKSVAIELRALLKCIRNKKTVRNSNDPTQKGKRAAELPEETDKYASSKLNSLLELFKSKKASFDEYRKSLQRAGGEGESPNMSGVAGASGPIQNEDSHGDQEAAVQRHWRKGVPLLTMEQAIAKLGREMKSTTDQSYWNEITALLDEKMIPYKTGSWSAREDEILITNWIDLTEEINFGAEEIIYAKRTDANASIKKALKTSKFYLRLTSGLNRTSYSVYIRARKLFDPKHHGLDLTEEEKLQLDQLTEKHGKKWGKIGEDMGYSGQALINYVYTMEQRQVNCDPFSEEEDEAILELVRQEFGKQNVSQVYRVPWARILSQESILTKNSRTSSQCRER